jgi:predicted nucleic acid-binding protein
MAAEASPTLLYVETSAALRAVLERGLSPEVEKRLASAGTLLTSRLSLVETARAFHRLRASSRAPEKNLARVERELDELWSRCDVWEVTPEVCDLAARVAPLHPLRTLDAIHVATLLLARRRLGDVDLLTADDRLRIASGAAR